jgi:hypothetical protein
MGYKNKFRESLDISWDYDTNPKKIYPVLLFTPNSKNIDEHFHISLNRREAKILKTWLDEYLKQKPKKKPRK